MRENIINQDTLQVQGRMTLGYGIIPKIPMHDPRLTIEAKAIYSYFCSYAGSGTTAFPRRDKILRDLQIGEDRYYRHFNLLKNFGYITVEQTIDNTGKFKNNIYTLVEMVEPYPQNKGTEPYPQNPHTDNPNTVNEGTISNSLVINKKTINNSVDNQQSKSMSDKQKKLPKDTNKMTNDFDYESSQTDKKILFEKEYEKGLPTAAAQLADLRSPSSDNTIIYDYSRTKEKLQENIEYNFYVDNRSLELEFVNQIIEAMLDVICTNTPTVKIGRENKNRDMVRALYLQLNSGDIDHVIERFKEQRHKIKHPHAYIKTMLFTVRQESGFFWTNLVRVDGVV